MNTVIWFAKRTVIGLLLTLAAVSLSFADELDGTWRLVKRQLPDGTILTPPTVVGLSTVYNGLRHTNVFWHTPDGKPASINVIAEVKLTASKYTETLLAQAVDDGSGNPVAYNLSGETKSVPAKRQGSRVSFKMPFDPPSVVIDGDTRTATLEGVFVDYWERVK